MELLDVKVNKKGMIEADFEEAERQILEKVAVYKDVIVTADNLKESKKDLAELRKDIAAIEDMRKNIKKQWMVPYSEFEGKCKQLIEPLTETIEAIDSQVKVFESERIEEKKKLIQKLYDENMVGYEEYLPLESIFKEQWLNVSTKEKDVLFDLSEAKTRVVSDLNVIHGLKSEIEEDIIEVYKTSGLAAAIERNTIYMQDKAKILAKTERKPSAEAMGSLNEIVSKFRTVRFIVSKEDAEEVENLLNLSDISFQKLEG